MLHLPLLRKSALALIALGIALAAALSSCAGAQRGGPPPASTFESGGFVTGASTESEAVAAGERVNILASVTSRTDTKAVVDVEIYSPAHDKLYQQSFEDQALSRGKARTYDVRWNVPVVLATATAIVKIGIFTPDWTELSHWNDDATTLLIEPVGSHANAPNDKAIELTDQSTTFPYVSGANLPWYNWACDFGCGSAKGVSDPAVTSALDSVFATAQGGGFQVVRWWMFEGNPWQITTDANGAPIGLNPAVYADVDAAVNPGCRASIWPSTSCCSTPRRPGRPVELGSPIRPQRA